MLVPSVLAAQRDREVPPASLGTWQHSADMYYSSAVDAATVRRSGIGRPSAHLQDIGFGAS